MFDVKSMLYLCTKKTKSWTPLTNHLQKKKTYSLASLVLKSYLVYCYVFLIAVTTKKRLCTVPFAPWTRSRPGVSRSMRRREPRKPPCSRKRSISSWILLKWKPLMIRKEQNLCFDMLRCFLLFLFAWFFFQVFFSLTWMIPKCKWVFWNCAIFDVVLRHKMQLQGLIVETGKGYLAPNMPDGSGDCIPRKLPNQTPPSLGCLDVDPGPTKFPTYFRNLANCILILWFQVETDQKDILP